MRVVDDAGIIVRLAHSGQDHAEAAGFSWFVGDHTLPEELERVAELMADAVFASISGLPLPDDVRGLFLTETIPDLDRLDGIMFSGGVAEYIYGREPRDFGDLGQLLGLALRAGIAADRLAAPMLPPVNAYAPPSSGHPSTACS